MPGQWPDLPPPEASELGNILDHDIVELDLALLMQEGVLTVERMNVGDLQLKQYRHALRVPKSQLECIGRIGRGARDEESSFDGILCFWNLHSLLDPSKLWDDWSHL